MLNSNTEKDKTYEILLSKMQEIALVPPQTVGPFTPIYKKIVPLFKFYPVRSISLVAFISAILLYLILGSLSVRIASILQFGF